ncbi:MAG: S-methyl-5'-thioadenosine phosphorylase [Dehalococcoidia bacterium]|nr:S-methyl-5'-thioadenosine phosphorylase [Dehalococcoidia bacterium]
MAPTTKTAPPVTGIIGGTGLYGIEGFEGAQWVDVESPFGTPSDKLLIGDFKGHRLVFLPRHGRGHRIPPSQINYRANIEALKRAGVTQVISFSAVGSLREDLAPGTFVIVDQYIDRTFAREKSFFGEGFTAHVSMADPVCARLGDVLEAAAKQAKTPVIRGGTYIVMEGPQFSTRAESELYRSWGCDVIGMTNMPEAKLAREAEMCYATVAMVTDYDCWHPHHEAVTATAILKVLAENTGHARNLIRAVVPALDAAPPPPHSNSKNTTNCPHGCDRALSSAIATAPGSRDPALSRKLSFIAGRVMSEKGWT